MTIALVRKSQRFALKPEPRRSLMAILWARDLGLCFWCGATCILTPVGAHGKVPQLAATIDHLIPACRTKAATKLGMDRHDPQFCVLACHRCNQSRGSRRALHFVESLYGRDV